MVALVGRGAEQAELNRNWQAARGGPGGMNWRVPLLARMVVFHLAPPSALFLSDVEILSLPFKEQRI